MHNPQSSFSEDYLPLFQQVSGASSGFAARIPAVDLLLKISTTQKSESGFARCRRVAPRCESLLRKDNGKCGMNDEREITVIFR
jgi:hypothetical protein